MAKPITPQEMTAYVEATWDKCKKEAWQEAEDVWQKALENALVYGTGFVRFDSMGGISVVDPKDYYYLENKDSLQYLKFLKEKNGG